ncbi:hypothetical protein ACFW6V_04825 [Streptomyces sp. NPDC058734]|uniref:hypothetical protein n=1 Tax=Streptomyces sp. NPDC058734 TaxID=3346615 RepID=UPI0036808067
MTLEVVASRVGTPIPSVTSRLSSRGETSAVMWSGGTPSARDGDGQPDEARGDDAVVVLGVVEEAGIAGQFLQGPPGPAQCAAQGQRRLPHGDVSAVERAAADPGQHHDEVVET